VGLFSFQYRVTNVCEVGTPCPAALFYLAKPSSQWLTVLVGTHHTVPIVEHKCSFQALVPTNGPAISPFHSLVFGRKSLCPGELPHLQELQL
jgi:hypothetical protein